MSVTLILGPMFSGKSTELIRRLGRYQNGGKPSRVGLIRANLDTRHDKMVTHGGIELDMTMVREWKTRTLVDIQDDILREHITVFAVDEGQFFPDLADFCRWVVSKGLICIISGLSGDYMQKPFSSISLSIPYCTEIKHLTAICAHPGCACEAPYTIRTSAYTATREPREPKEAQIVVGGSEIYMPVCSSHLAPEAPCDRDSHAVRSVVRRYTGRHEE